MAQHREIIKLLGRSSDRLKKNIIAHEYQRLTYGMWRVAKSRRSGRLQGLIKLSVEDKEIQALLLKVL